jgi:tetratricopeptide (TPR) repeat protein
LELDNTLAEAHYAFAFVAWREWDWERAETSLQRAIELNPNFPDAHAYYSHLLSIVGREDEALPHSERAIELDPLNALFHGMYAMVLLYHRHYDDAMAAARTALALQPDNSVARGALQDCLIAKGMRDEQLAIQRARIALDPERVAAFERGLEEGGYEGEHSGASRMSWQSGTRSLASGFSRPMALPIGISTLATTTGPSTGSKKATRSTIPPCATSACQSTIHCAPTLASKTCCARSGSRWRKRNSYFLRPKFFICRLFKIENGAKLIISRHI